MRYGKLLGLTGFFAISLLCTTVRAQEATDEAADTHNTEQPKEAEAPTPVLSPAATVPATAVEAPPAGPKLGDVSVSGYFRGGFGASNQKGRMTCFSLAIPGSMVSKYRLGNECEVWSETHFTVVTYVGADGAVATMHFMPTVYIPTTYIGYSPTSTTNSPAAFTTSTGATLSFPNLYVDLKGVSGLGGGTAWIGNRYYKRESIYISDFFYWNPSGVGGGIEDINLGKDVRLSYGAFAVDGEPAPVGGTGGPSLPAQSDFGLRNDIQLRGIKPYESGELQLGFQYIANLSNNPDTSSGWGVTVQFVQKLLGGDNKLAFQYGRGGGTGFGTLARFYYPDFSVRHHTNEFRYRAVDVFTIQPTPWLGGQIGLVYQHDDLGTAGTKSDWYSAGGRVAVALSTHFKILGEAGFDRVKKDNGAEAQWLGKFTIAPTLAAAGGLLSRPELRLFYTWATWNATAQTATIDSGRLYTDTYPDYRSGATFGLQAETWW